MEARAGRQIRQQPTGFLLADQSPTDAVAHRARTLVQPLERSPTFFALCRPSNGSFGKTVQTLYLCPADQSMCRFNGNGTCSRIHCVAHVLGRQTGVHFAGTCARSLSL